MSNDTRSFPDVFSAYLAPRGFEAELLRELGGSVLAVRDRLVLASGAPRDVAWAQNVWLNPRWIPIGSIGDAARKLKGLQRNWALYSTGLHRRAALIQEKLPKVSARRQVFDEPPPSASLGSWTLWEENLLLASPACASPWPHGEAEFEENKTEPPGRAYLKLWELFTRLGVKPAPGELCLDLGASPGGWSWVLAGLGARVFAVDKADLAANVAAMPNVEHCRGSAFGLDPRMVGAADWLFSDVICYPDRLLAMVERWLELGECRRFVCTVKLQSETDFTVLERFRAIPDSRLLHLHHNKHELTWLRL